LWDHLNPNFDIFAGVDKKQLDPKFVEELSRPITKEELLAKEEGKGGKKLDIQAAISPASLAESQKQIDEYKSKKAKFTQNLLDNVFSKYFESTLKKVGITSMPTHYQQIHPDMFSNYLKCAVNTIKSPRLALTILQCYETYVAYLRRCKIDASLNKKKLWLTPEDLPPEAKAIHQVTINMMEDVLASVEVLEDISEFADTQRLNILKSTLLMLQGETINAYLDRSPTMAYIIEKEQKESRWLEFEGGESEEVTWANFWAAAAAKHAHEEHHDTHAKDHKKESAKDHKKEPAKDQAHAKDDKKH